MRILAICLFVFFNSCSLKTDTIKVKGSDTEVNLAVLLAEQFHSENTEILVSVSGGGSGLGIASLLNGNTDIANSSRSIKKEEMALFQKHGILLDSFIFAQDAIAFVVSEKLPIDSINVNQISKILSGEFKNWNSVSAINKPITIYGRQSNSGTHDFVKNILGIRFSPNSKQMNGNAQIIEAIKADNSGIGYVSAGYVMKGTTKGIKILSVFSEKRNAVSPLDAEKIASGEYFFQRPLFQYFRKDDYNKIKPFLDFEKSAMGKKIIEASGYYPVNTLK
jgi:phosphate transport system substrate-binding protein